MMQPIPKDAPKLEAWKELTSTLTEKERMVLEKRFGVLDGQSHTLQACGDFFGCTRERIRQIEAKALRKIRSYCDNLKIESDPSVFTDSPALAGEVESR